MSQHDSGAYTGDISGAFLAKLGCTFVVVGHSERRTYHREDDALVAAKAAAAFKHGITPIICIGEQLEVREAGNHVEYNVNSLRGSLAGLSARSRSARRSSPTSRCGRSAPAGWPARPTRRRCARPSAVSWATCPRRELAAGVRVLYGGSVNAKNVGEIVAQGDVDGALVGGASLDGEQFAHAVGHRRGRTAAVTPGAWAGHRTR